MAAFHLKFDGLDEPIADSSSSTTGPEKQPATNAATAVKRLRNPASWFQSLHQKKNAYSGNDSASRDEMIVFEKKVAAILRDYLEPEKLSQPLSPEKAVESILDLLPPSISSTDNNRVGACSVAALCLEAAEQIPYHHPSQPKLAQLCAALAETPRFLDMTPSGIPQQSFFQALKEVLRENYEGPYSDTPPLHWVNYHAFLALLDHYRAGVPSSLYAVWAMRDAWENEPDDPNEKDCLVMGAAQ